MKSLTLMALGVRTLLNQTANLHTWSKQKMKETLGRSLSKLVDLLLAIITGVIRMLSLSLIIKLFSL
jgi:hypothetical protein